MKEPTQPTNRPTDQPQHAAGGQLQQTTVAHRATSDTPIDAYFRSVVAAP